MGRRVRASSGQCQDRKKATERCSDAVVKVGV